MNRIFNFSSGPAQLPLEVLEQVKSDLMSYRSTGIGILEMSHRDPRFEPILDEAKALLVKLLGIPESYSVLFMTGGATAQFSAVPLNLLPQGESADYILSGYWSERAVSEGGKFGTIRIAGSSKDAQFKHLPKSIDPDPNAAYLHFTSNNTIIGTQWQSEPSNGAVPLICDASSDICSRPIDVSKYGVIYAGAQKNLGAIGVTVVIIRNDLIERAPGGIPVQLQYRTYSQHNSLFNTPPTFSIYVVRELLTWLANQGGLEVIKSRNAEKAAILYNFLDNSELFYGYVEKEARSAVNITFKTRRPELEAQFLAEAESAGFTALGGHRSVGGFRASIYNAFPKEGVAKLVEFMDQFERKMK